MHKKVDVAIIGAGTAGLTALRAVQRVGKTAVLIEGGPHGTTCARVGCMPSKLLIAAANAAHTARTTAEYGVKVSQVTVDGHAVMQRVKIERDRFVSFVLDDVAALPTDTLLTGYAHFLNDHTLEMDNGERIHAQASVIATGTSPFIPSTLQGFPSTLVGTTDDVFYWDTLPKRVAILGAGVIGLELGQALHRLGVQVTIINRSQNVVGIVDPSVKAQAQKIFDAELPLWLDTQLLQAKQNTDDSISLTLKNATQSMSTLTVDYVLCAAGRRPNVDTLQLSTTSAQLDERGMPRFDASTLNITGTPLFFAGDVNGLHPILHEAADDGRLAGENAASWPRTPQSGERRTPMSIAFTEPNVMQVGVPYHELPNDCVVGEVSFDNQGRSRIMRENQGILRVYASSNGQLIGAAMVGPAGEHIAHLLAWAIQQQLTVSELLAMPFYHPVIEEGVRTALVHAVRQLRT